MDVVQPVDSVKQEDDGSVSFLGMVELVHGVLVSRYHCQERGHHSDQNGVFSLRRRPQ